MPEEIEQACQADQVSDFASVVVRVAAQVLETMFFEEAVPGPCEHGWLADALSVQVSFEGSHRGDFLLSVSADTARSIASGFLGLDPEELTGEQPGEVMLELANILCGALMSALWPESSLSLESPALVNSAHDVPNSKHCCFTLPGGNVAVSLGLADGASGFNGG
jgi:CheY-specific phosphatase CheX